MHLTNYSINKKNEGAYQSNADESVCQGHKWSVYVVCVVNYLLLAEFEGSCRILQYVIHLQHA